MKKRVLSLFMALALCLIPLPTAALAEEAANANSTYTTGEDGGLTGGSSGEMQDVEADAAAEAGTHTAHCVCGKDSGTTVKGHTTHSTDTTWTAATSLPGTAGSYYLTQPVSGDWTVPTGEVNLCLNGQTINGKITVGSGAKLTLTDCTGSGRVQGEVTVNGGKFELYDGTITGGVQVGINGGTYQTGSSFTMYGGAITGNEESSGSGGGVFLVGTTNTSGQTPHFTMHGGTISDNTAGASDGGGGGVYVGEKCSFTMDGGTITGNTAANGNGGGIYIHMLANVTISGGEITNNKAPAKNSTSYGHGGGIYSESGVTVKNVTITGNNSNFEGGGIYGKGTINLTDATVTGNNQYDVYYGGQESTTPKLTVSGSVKAGYYANNDWKLPIFVSGALSEDSVIRVGVYKGIKPNAGGSLLIAKPASGVTLSAKNFKADAADSVTSLGEDGKVYLSLCDHEMDDTGYTCSKCGTQFDARVGESAYYQTLTEAFSAVRDSTVTLLRDVTLTRNCSAAYDSPATLDLNGKTVSSESYDIGVGGGNKPNTLTVKDSSKGGGTQALNVKFWVASNGTLAVDDSYTGEISRVELQAGGTLERFGGEIAELVLSNAAYGSSSTGYGLKLWKGNTNACTIGKFTDNNKSKSLTVKDLLKTNHAKCELYGEKDGTWSIVDKSAKIVDLTGYTAYKVQFPECVHQCADDSNPVCSVCNKNLYTKITAQSTDGTTKTAYFTEDSALENGYAEAIQTLNGWSNEGCTEPTLTLLRDMYAFGTSMPLTGTLTLEGGTHTAKNVTVAENANVTFASGSYRGATIDGTATVEGGVTFTTASVEVNGTLNVEGGTFNGPVKFKGSSIANISGGSFTSDRVHDGVKFDYNVTGTISGGTFVFADFYTTKVKLSGGTFTTIITNGDRKLADLLAEGAAYYKTVDDQAVTNDSVNKLENVKVTSHAHNGGTDGNGTCSICGKQMAASLTVGGKTSWYTAFASAIEAANAADGEKTITLYQNVDDTAYGKRTAYELTRGPVTLATGGKTVKGVELIAKGISLTVTGSNGSFYVTVDGKDAELTVNDKDTELAIVTAKNGGKLSLSNGTFSRVAVKDDGSSASLSGGSYGAITSDAGYVKPYALLAKGYAYKKTTDNEWLPNANSIPSKVTVEKAPFAVEKIYPNSDTDYTGNSAFATDGNITLTAVIAPETEGVTYYYWWELFDESKKDWTITFRNVNSATHTGGQSKTLTISGLPVDKSYQYHIFVQCSNGYQCYSEPFTVTRHQHSWTYTASGATITASCTDTTCTSPNGGSVTINKPAHTTYGDGQSEKATLTENSWQGLAVDQDAITYTKDGTSLEAAPTDAGTYTASITLGEGENAKTASVEYTIAKATPSVGSWQGYPQAQSVFSGNAIQNPTSLTIYLDGKPSNLIPVNQLKFNWYNATKNGNDYVKNGDALGKNPTDAGDYIIEAVFAGDNNINAATSEWGLTIGKADHANNGVSIEVPLTVYPASGEYIYDVDIAKALKNIPHGGGLEPNTRYGGISTNVNFVKSTKWDNGKLFVTMRSLAGITGTTLGSITVNLTSKNYTVVPVVVNIMLQPKQEVQDISVSMDNWTYGEKAKTPWYATMAGVEATVTYAAQGSSDFSTTVPTNAGNYTVKVQYEAAIMIHTGTANFTIAPKNISGVTINLGQQATYNGREQDVAISSVMDGTYSLIAGGHDYAVVRGNKATNVGENTLVIKGKGNYTGTASENWSLNAKKVTIDWGNITDRKWKDGKTVTATVSNKVDNDEVNVTVTGGDQTAVGSLHTATAAGLTGAQAGNYRLPADKEQTYSIGKADACKLLDITVSQKQSVTTEQSKDIGRAGMPADAGTLTYKLGASSVNGTATVNSFTIDENGMVKYTITGGAANDTVTLPVTIGSDNYADSIVNVVITLTDKDTPAVSAKDITVTYDGNAIPDSKITGTATFNGNTVEGAWGFKTTAPKFVADSNDSVAVVFTPNDATTYAAVETNIKVTINKATPTGTPIYEKITASDKTLADAKLNAIDAERKSVFSASGTEVPGTIKWVDKDGNDLTNDLANIKVVQGESYKWLFTPTDHNYKELAGTIVLWAKPASGGGGGVVTPAPTPSDADVITVKKDAKDNTTSKPGAETDTTITTKTTVKNTTTATTKNEQGQDVSKTTASVSKDLGDKLLDQAVSNKSDTIEITVKSNETNNNGSGAGASAADSVKATEVELPKATVNAIAKDTNADLVIKTDNGEVVLDNKTLETIAGAANGDTVTIVVGENTQLKERQKPAEKIVGKNGTFFDLAAKIGERLLHQFEGGKAHVTLPMPEKLKGKDVLVIYIDDNGLCKILNHSVEKIGAEDYIRFTTTHFSTFAVVDKDEAERLMKEQNAAHVKELMQSAKFKVTTTKTSKKSVKVTVTAKNNKTLISDIKTMGYTVKYQFYRSTKKTSGYKLLKTKTTNTFTNTKGIKGTKYYYKARVLVYDGKKLVAKSALGQCSYGVRTWTK